MKIAITGRLMATCGSPTQVQCDLSAATRLSAPCLCKAFWGRFHVPDVSRLLFQHFGKAPLVLNMSQRLHADTHLCVAILPAAIKSFISTE